MVVLFGRVSRRDGSALVEAEEAHPRSHVTDDGDPWLSTASCWTSSPESLIARR
jgi:hypothetical protein